MEKRIIKIISDELTKSRVKNPSYSLRAFAKRIGVQPSAISEILNGKRPVTKKMGKKILEGLGTSSVETNSIINNNSITGEELLTLDHFKTISQWQYFAILSLAEIEDFKGCPNWIANRLNIKPKDAKAFLERLIKLNMLVQDSEGNYTATGVQYKTPTDLVNSSLKRHTLETLELAKESLIKDDIELRDFSTITMAIDPKKLGEAKKMIKTFRKKISNKLENGNKKEVYKIAIQLFPLSREIKGRDNV